MIIMRKGKVVSLELQNVQKIGDRFLCYNRALTSLKLPMVQKIGNGFLNYNEAMKKTGSIRVRETPLGGLVAVL